jgi:hypothetical protein
MLEAPAYQSVLPQFQRPPSPSIKTANGRSNVWPLEKAKIAAAAKESYPELSYRAHRVVSAKPTV